MKREFMQHVSRFKNHIRGSYFVPDPNLFNFIHGLFDCPIFLHRSRWVCNPTANAIGLQTRRERFWKTSGQVLNLVRIIRLRARERGRAHQEKWQIMLILKVLIYFETIKSSWLTSPRTLTSGLPCASVCTSCGHSNALSIA